VSAASLVSYVGRNSKGAICPILEGVKTIKIIVMALTMAVHDAHASHVMQCYIDGVQPAILGHSLLSS
jgi:chromate transport protein ChrA